MGFSLCSSSTKISISCLESICTNNNPKSVVRKAFGSVCGSNWRSKRLISCQLVPRQLEGSYVGKKKLYESPSVKLEFVRTLLIDNYDSYTYNIYQELSVINGLPPVVIRNDEWSWEDICYYLYEVKAFDNIVISPGPGSPTCPSDIGVCPRLLLECSDIPILGVCLGHQALGYVHGAQVIHAPQPIHGRLSEIEHNNCGLFNGIPTGQGFKVVRYHSLVIDPATLPQELIPIAWTTSSKTISSFETYYSGFERQEAGSHKSYNSSSVKLENRNILMGIMHSTRPHYGLQFHPESIATSHGRQIFKNFADITREYWFGLMRSSSDRGRKANYSACTQVPNVTSKHLVNGFDSTCLRNLLNTSSSRDSRFLKLKWRKVECSASQIGGAENIFCALFGDHHAENTFWLDSSSTEKDRARFSFMGGKGGSLWRQVTYRLLNKSDVAYNRGGNLSIEDADGNITSTYLEDGFFDFLDKELQSFRYDANDYKGLPFDFYGGYIGYIGYDLKIECGARTNRHKSRAPDACLFFADNILVIDHLYDHIYIMSIFDKSPITSPWMDTIEKKLLDMKLYPPTKPVPLLTKKPPKENRFTPEKSKEQYITDIEKCLEFIRNGESYELCLTTKMTRNIGKVNSLGFYLNLRRRNPAPYAAWLSFPKEDLCICSSSPERFLKLDRNEVLEAKPIKGTIPRGASPEEDELNKKRLQYSEKDQAENLMIVDLLRNDLGRVCDLGSVHVPHLMEVESYATVHTMVTTIRGRKRADVSAVGCVRAAFPGGSMTGAPKLRSMEILDSLESGSRGIYSGCIGYFSYNQKFDLNIVIRTIVVKDGEASVGAGGAITALSNSEGEYEEMVLKTRAPASAVSELVDGDS